MAFVNLFTPFKAGTIPVTTSTSSLATSLGAKVPNQVRIKNNDTINTVFIDFGVSTDTVTTSNGIPIGPGDVAGFTIPGTTTHILTIASAATPLLYVTPGWGS